MRSVKKNMLGRRKYSNSRRTRKVRGRQSSSRKQNRRQSSSRRQNRRQSRSRKQSSSRRQRGKRSQKGKQNRRRRNKQTGGAPGDFFLDEGKIYFETRYTETGETIFENVMNPDEKVRELKNQENIFTSNTRSLFEMDEEGETIKYLRDEEIDKEYQAHTKLKLPPNVIFFQGSWLGIVAYVKPENENTFTKIFPRNFGKINPGDADVYNGYIAYGSLPGFLRPFIVKIAEARGITLEEPPTLILNKDDSKTLGGKAA